MPLWIRTGILILKPSATMRQRFKLDQRKLGGKRTPRQWCTIAWLNWNPKEPRAQKVLKQHFLTATHRIISLIPQRAQAAYLPPFPETTGDAPAASTTIRLPSFLLQEKSTSRTAADSQGNLPVSFLHLQTEITWKLIPMTPRHHGFIAFCSVWRR